MNDWTKVCHAQSSFNNEESDYCKCDNNRREKEEKGRGEHLMEMSHVYISGMCYLFSHFLVILVVEVCLALCSSSLQ